jgi:hypothetical protein
MAEDSDRPRGISSQAADTTTCKEVPVLIDLTSERAKRSPSQAASAERPTRRAALARMGGAAGAVVLFPTATQQGADDTPLLDIVDAEMLEQMHELEQLQPVTAEIFRDALDELLWMARDIASGDLVIDEPEAGPVDWIELAYVRKAGRRPRLPFVIVTRDGSALVPQD